MFRFLTGKYTDSATWLATPKARLFLLYERRMLQEILPALCGYRGVQIGSWGNDRGVLDKAGTLCHWQLGFGEAGASDIRFDGRHLPLATGSVDAIVIAHGLERVAEPHALLRECARALSARGQLVVLAFNPLSSWAFRQGLSSRRHPAFQPCSAPPTASRLFDWLRLLEFEPEQLWRYGLGFPFFGGAHEMGSGRRWARCVGWSAQSYAIVARRHVTPRTRIGRPARRRTAQTAVGLARHSSGRVICRR
ncbi:methylase involved in ubiquinone/menaquinone biosynthesis [Salinisphaera dokdonensis CL-ES53]|uniref:Methylase involved in ubiquinone/menaquinone biosynthesis n=2 Tax=Salinisphaera TaxID=180541 RepID=A0ABV2B460_9GAMM